MPPNPRAQRNHDALFPGHVSTLAETDPELIEVFDNFAFDEVLRNSELDVRSLTRSGIDLPSCELLTLSMLVGLGGCDPQVRGHATANLNVGNSRARLIDVLTQILPFIGYPRTLSGLRAVDEAAPLAGKGAPSPFPG